MEAFDQAILAALPTFVIQIVQDLAKEGAESVWLIGSRANGTEREDSDWDLLVFVPYDPKPFEVKEDRVDVLVFGPNGNGVASRIDKIDWSLSIVDWSWTQISSTEARYTQRKHCEGPDGFTVGDTSRKRGILVFQRDVLNGRNEL